jgi:hypothetical protein
MLPFYTICLFYGSMHEHETVRNAVGVLMFHMGNPLFRPNALDSESDF